MLSTKVTVRAGIWASFFSLAASLLGCGGGGAGGLVYPGLFAVVSDTADGTLSVLNLDSATVSLYRVFAFPVGSQPGAVSISDDGFLALVGEDAEDTAHVVRGILYPGASRDAVSLAPGGARGTAIAGAFGLVTQPSFNQIAILNLSARPPTVTGALSLPASAQPEGICASVDGSAVLVGGSGRDEVYVLEVATSIGLRATVPLDAGAQPAQVAISPDGLTGATANAGNDSLSIISLSGTPAITRTVTLTGGSDVSGISFVTDNLLVFTATGTDRAYTLDLANPDSTPELIFDGSSSSSDPVAVAGDGDHARALIVNRSADNVVAVTLSGDTQSIAVGNQPTAIAVGRVR